MTRWIEFFTRELATARGGKAARRARHATGCARATPHSDRAEGHGSRRRPGPGSADDRRRSTPPFRNSASLSEAGSPRVRRACRAAASGTREPRGITCRHAARPERRSALAPNYRHQRVRLTPRRAVPAGVRRAGGRWNRAVGPRAGRSPSPRWRFDLAAGLVQSIPTTPPAWTTYRRSWDRGHRANPRCGAGPWGPDCDVRGVLTGGLAWCRRRSDDDRQLRLCIGPRSVHGGSAAVSMIRGAPANY